MASIGLVEDTLNGGPSSETDNPSELFAPSLMSEVGKLVEQDKLTLEPQPTIKLVPEDLQGIVQMPFDITAFVTKYKGFGLSDNEAERLCKIWLKPIQRLYGMNPNLDLWIAVTCTLSIIGEKTIEYTLERDSRARYERQRKDELSKESPTGSLAPVHN